MVKKGSSLGSSLGSRSSRSSASKDSGSDWLFYTVVVVGFFMLVALGYLLFSGKCFETFENTHVLEYYYMESCPHCNDFNPEWEKLAAEFTKEKIQIELKKIDLQAPEHKELVQERGVSGAPTIMFVKGGAAPIEYQGDRTSAKIVQYVKKAVSPAAAKAAPVTATATATSA